MTYPTKYTRQYDFQSYQVSNPTRPLPGDKVNVDLNAVVTSVDEVVEFLKTSIRADGRLANGSVGVNQLDSTFDLGFSLPTTWEAGVAYTTDSTVLHDNKFYIANTAHTSTDGFDESKWDLIVDFGEQAAAAAASATAAAASQTAAASSATAASGSATTATTQATAASSSATSASSSATTATTQATNASNSATAAATSATNASNSATAAAISETNAAASAAAAAASAGAVDSYNGVTGAVAGFTADKVYFVSTAGNDSNNGLSPESAFLTLQTAITAASGGGTVYVGAGTYTQTANLLMQPGVRLVGVRGATIITQGSAADLGRIVDFATNSADGAGLDGITIDGNRANNTEGLGVLCYVGTANDVVIENSSFINGTGNVIIISTGLRPIVRMNYFSNFNLYGCVVLTGVPQTATNGMFTDNVFMRPIGIHPIAFIQSNGNLINRNRIYATQVGGRSAPTHVTTSGTTVTWVSGPDFTTIFPGMFVVMTAGGEYFITAKASNTSLTVNSSPGSHTNVEAILGTGDLIGVDNASDNVISDNYLEGGVTGGVVISQFTGGADTRYTVIDNNFIYGSGECAICLTTTSNGTVISDTKIRNNTIVDSVQAGTTAGPGGAFLAGITLAGGSDLLQTFIAGNTLTDDQVSKSMSYWLGISGLSAGQVFTSDNYATGMGNGVNQAILGGIGTVSLSGWGSGAAVSNLASYGSSFFMNITAGTGPSANPTVTVPTVVTGVSPVGAAKAYANSTGVTVNVIGDQGMSVSSKVFSFFGFTPTASAAYTLFVSS